MFHCLKCFLRLFFLPLIVYVQNEDFSDIFPYSGHIHTFTNSIRLWNKSHIENKIEWSHMCSILSFQFVMAKLHLFSSFLWLFKTLSDQRHVRRYGIVCYSCMTMNALKFISRSAAVQHAMSTARHNSFRCDNFAHTSCFLENEKKKLVGQAETRLLANISLVYFITDLKSCKKNIRECETSTWVKNITKWINNYFDDLQYPSSNRPLLVNIDRTTKLWYRKHI